MSERMPIVRTGTRMRSIAVSSAAPAATDVVQVHRLADHEIGVGVEAAHELVAVVLEIALDLEALPQREAVRAAARPPRDRTGR